MYVFDTMLTVAIHYINLVLHIATTPYWVILASCIIAVPLLCYVVEHLSCNTPYTTQSVLVIDLS